MEHYKYCVVWSVPRRGLYTINVGTEQGVINSPWKVGTVFKETSEETCTTCKAVVEGRLPAQAGWRQSWA